MNSSENNQLENDISQEIEKIREKTFNDEFKELVSRVTSHGAKVDDLQIEEEKELLIRFQKLFYKSCNLFWRNDAYLGFDPLELPQRNELEELALAIFSEMDAMGFSHFAILAYDFQKKSFVCKINHITQLDRENIILDVEEQLFKKIVRSRNGVILKKDEIANDLFLKKRFSFAKNSFIPPALFFLSLDCFQEMIASKHSSEIISLPPTIPMILMILLDQSDLYDADTIFTQLRKKLALHFILYKNVLYPQTKEFYAANFEAAISVLEYYFTLFCQIREGGFMLLRYPSCAGPECDYLFAFLVNKLFSSFSNKIALVTVVRHITCLFFDRDGFSQIVSFVKKYCEEMGNFFEMIIFNHEHTSTFNKLLDECFMKNQ